MNAQSNQRVKVNLLIDDINWKKVKGIKPLTVNALAKSLLTINFFKSFDLAELTIKLADDHELSSLNKAFLHKEKPTNVLSFPFYEIKEGDFKTLAKCKKLYLGDIALSYSTIYNESIQQEKKFEDHFMHLLVHGLLHLCGYDHDTPKKTKRMKGLEIDILKHFSIFNPY